MSDAPVENTVRDVGAFKSFDIVLAYLKTLFELVLAPNWWYASNSDLAYIRSPKNVQEAWFRVVEIGSSGPDDTKEMITSALWLGVYPCAALPPPLPPSPTDSDKRHRHTTALPPAAHHAPRGARCGPVWAAHSRVSHAPNARAVSGYMSDPLHVLLPYWPWTIRA